MVLRRTFGPKRDQIMGWIKLHSDQLHNLYSSPHHYNDQVTDDEKGWARSTHEGEK
jgi:hypothetical protein